MVCADGWQQTEREQLGEGIAGEREINGGYALGRENGDDAWGERDRMKETRR